MALRIDSINELATYSSSGSVNRETRPAHSSSSTAANGTQTAQSEAAQPPSFSAVFAQIAAAADAAGTTVASTATAAGGTSTSSAPAAVAQQASSASTAADPSADPAGSLFGADPWLTDPTGDGPNGTVTNYNPIYFATQQTAETVAQMVGGGVVESNQMVTSPGSPFGQNQPNYMVQLPDGAQVNPGLIADIYSHGWSQSLINEQVANEVAGAEAAVGS